MTEIGKNLADAIGYCATAIAACFFFYFYFKALIKRSNDD